MANTRIAHGPFTDYTYQVLVRVDSHTGATEAFITSEGGDIGKASTHFDIFCQCCHFAGHIS